MADLDNLLDDINNVEEIEADDQQQQPYEGEDDYGDDITAEGSEQAAVPAALAAAAARRRQLEENAEFGAGDEERDYQAGIGDGGDIGFGDGDEGDGRNYNED